MVILSFSVREAKLQGKNREREENIKKKEHELFYYFFRLPPLHIIGEG